MLDIQTLTIVITGIGVLIAAVNQIYTSRQANQQRQTEIDTRQAEPFMNVYNRWNTLEFMKAYQFVNQHDWNLTYQEFLQQITIEETY